MALPRAVPLTSSPQAKRMCPSLVTHRPERSVCIPCPGSVYNLAGLLAPPGPPPLIAQKVRYLVVAADALTMSDIPAAKRLFAEWPTPVAIAQIGSASRYHKR